METNIDYMVSEYDQEQNTIGVALKLPFEVFDINVTAEYSYTCGRPQTYYDPQEYDYCEIESYYIAGVYNGSKFVSITKEQSEIILNIKPWVMDSDILTNTIADCHTDKDDF